MQTLPFLLEVLSENSEFVHMIFSLVWVAKWPPFGKELLTWLTIMLSLYFDYL